MAEMKFDKTAWNETVKAISEEDSNFKETKNLKNAMLITEDGIMYTGAGNGGDRIIDHREVLERYMDFAGHPEIDRYNGLWQSSIEQGFVIITPEQKAVIAPTYFTDKTLDATVKLYENGYMIDSSKLNKAFDYPEVYKIAQEVRSELDKKYKDITGHCVEASDMIKERLDKLGIQSEVVEGYCVYDDDSSCTDRCYDEHTWVIADGDVYVDVTADQFNSCLYDCNQFPAITISTIPECMVIEEPEYQWLDEKDEYEK